MFSHLYFEKNINNIKGAVLNLQGCINIIKLLKDNFINIFYV